MEAPSYRPSIRCLSLVLPLWSDSDPIRHFFGQCSAAKGLFLDGIISMGPSSDGDQVASKWKNGAAVVVR